MPFQSYPANDPDPHTCSCGDFAHLTQPRKATVLASTLSVCHNAGVMVTEGFDERKGFE
jgi:hypothetical protein